jgi:hypothetical protein
MLYPVEVPHNRPSLKEKFMKSSAVRALAVLLVVCFAFACTEHTPTSAPAVPAAPAAQGDLIGGLLSATGLLKCSSTPFAQSTATIGSEGGKISAGPHTLVIPAGALSAPTTITMTVPTGLSVDAVRFQPEGLRFAKPASLTMSYANCSLLGVLLPKKIVYTSDALQILETLLSLDNIFTRKVTGQVNHFSDYVVGW